MSFRRIKLTHILPDKPQIIDLPDVIRKINADPDAGPADGLQLSFYEWQQASANHYIFECLSFREGDLAHIPMFLKQHYGFFKNKKDTYELYSYWKDFEQGL
ncbi:hypothetical protein BDP27DRAFT_1364970 [Rhodocollybia butyracea]|uniref:Uncharacterized protein n=1 Tax=Rhodocollybia butyracea TaxID=206335 RepID=A0A9P5U6W4_9AGAR|nr:hypothetical protein BDP27DRAFT_1364970 [Rhodocollybia butyracea]